MNHEVTDFERQVLSRSRELPVVADFWAPWCGPCKMLGPVLEQLAASADGRWELVKINTDEQQNLATEYGISSIPAVKLFRHGKVVDEFVGFRQESQITAWLAPHLGAAGAEPPPDELEQAAEMIDDERIAEARPLLERVLAANPKRHAARLLLAEILLSETPAEAQRQLDEIPADADERAHAAALKLIVDAVQQDPARWPDDALKPRLVQGLAAVRRRDWDGALEAFVEVTERRRRFADGLAAEAGKAIFRYLGIRHPIADKHYRRFSSALNS